MQLVSCDWKRFEAFVELCVRKLWGYDGFGKENLGRWKEWTGWNRLARLLGGGGRVVGGWLRGFGGSFCWCFFF